MIMRTRFNRRAATVVAFACVLALVLVALWWLTMRNPGTKLTAYFEKTVGVYAGSEVKVLGVSIGHIDTVTPQGDTVRVELTVDDGVEIPADVHAIVVAPSL
ncbi:MAG TPA: MlaD family protein, partial [Actinophytocola sp.]|uniref:MlaD family protein n=1 Tax=Actinophytocola sp. TaxID=1872138 RepID=UPI002E0382D1|nr:MlaD family protein [Actinophytocola sp.]